jgi:hypothetical protein
MVGAFSYDDSCDKSTCLVADETTKAVCETKIAGKNTSNFAAHIKRFHKHAHETCVRKEMEKASAKNQAVKRDISGSAKSQTLKECTNRRIVSWPKESVEHQVRVQSILKMVIGTSCPLSLMDQPSFRDMSNVMGQQVQDAWYVCFLLFN